MNIYMKHPVHGQKVATLEAEAKYDETKGWARFDPVSPSPDPIATVKAEIPVLEKPKRGRPRKAP